MFNRSIAPLRLQVCRVLVVLALPVACAVGTEPEPANGVDTGTDGGSGGAATAGSPGSSGTGVVTPKGGASMGGNSGGIGGSGGAGGTGGGGKTSGGSAGSAGSAGASGASGGGNAGAGGGGAGGAGGAGGGSGGGTGSCDCSQKTVAWMDGVSTSFTTGDCVTADGKTFLYTGGKAQNFAHPDCHPGAQKMTWCAQTGSDYVFMACN